MKTLVKKLNKVLTKYNKKDTGYIYEVCNSNRKFKPLKSQIYMEYTELKFRDRSFMAIKEYDTLLKDRFSVDYLTTLPAEELRKPSHNQNIRIKEK